MSQNIATPINGNSEKLHEFLRIISGNENSPSDGTPLRANAFELDDDTKVELISRHFEDILNILGMDMTDDSLRDTPKRVAKMYVKEIFAGINPAHKPDVKLFDNKYQYNQMLVERDIKVHSSCEHHLVPIIGRAHVAYISNGKVIGLSKLNRIVDYYARRPQVQERLTEQIAHELKNVLGTNDVAVFIEASHMCVTLRGIKDEHSTTVTTSYHGKFKDRMVRNEFLNYLNTRESRHMS